MSNDRELVTVKVLETIKGQPRVRKGARVTLEPFYDSNGSGSLVVTGVSRKEWDSKYKEMYGDYDAFYKGKRDAITGKTYEGFKVVLTDLTRTFDMSDPLAQVSVALIKAHPWVANTETEITQESRYIVYDEVEVAKRENKTFEYELKAMKYLADMSTTERGEFLKLFGFKNTDSTKPELVMKRLKDQVKSNPQLFAEMYQDPSKEIKILLADLISNKILKRIGGVLYFGNDAVTGIALGTTNEQAVEFLRNPKHSDLYVQLERMLKEMKDKG